MKYSYKPIIPSVVNELKQAKEEFTLLTEDTPGATMASEWIEKNFPISSAGRIDWHNVPNNYCTTYDDYSNLIPALQNIVKQNALMDDVIILWTNALKLPLQMNLDVVLKHAEKIFEEDWDTWIFSEKHKWCIEVFHDDEIAFGYSCV